ncbi:unnamed protein product, partial [Polarella glacialis]
QEQHFESPAAAKIQEEPLQKEAPAAKVSHTPFVSTMSAAPVAPPVAPAAPPPPVVPAVEWSEVPGGAQGARAFKHALTGEVRQGPPPTTSWVELLADGGACYYWHVGRNVTQWEKPQ